MLGFYAHPGIPHLDAEPVAAADGESTSAQASADGSEPEVEACDLCGKQMQLKRGRFGPFYGCSGLDEDGVCQTLTRSKGRLSGQIDRKISSIEVY